MTFPKLDLPPDAKDLFDQARQTLKPSSAARDQVLRHLQSTLGAPGLPAQPRLESVQQAPSGAGPAQSVGRVVRPIARTPLRLVATAAKTLAGKMVLGVAIAATAGVSIRSLTHGRAAPIRSSRPPASVAGNASSPAIPPSPAAAPVEVPPLAPSTSAPPLLRSQKHPARQIPASQPTAPRPATPVDDDELIYRLGVEAGLLHQARADLRKGDVAGAQASLEEHRTRFPEGSLSEEREALLVETTLRAKGPGAARSGLEAFRRRYPQSFFLPALEAAFSGSAP